LLNYLDLARNQISNYRSSKITQQNLQEKTNILKNLKILTLSFKSLPPSKEKPITAEFELAREVNELEMELSCICKNERAFELSYLQEKPFYFDYIKDQNILPKQSDKYLYYVGLYLLFLLSNNRTTDFSTELELLDNKDKDNPYIKVSLDIEQFIVEGNYSHMAKLKNSTDDNYNYYLNKFDDTIRYQIARSMEKSYENLKWDNAMQLLMLKNENDLNEFIRQQNENPREDREIIWKREGDKIKFIPINENKASIPAYRIFNDSLLLGIETERIV
jgi:26S proteasome regulatory subunit N12